MTPIRRIRTGSTELTDGDAAAASSSGGGGGSSSGVDLKPLEMPATGTSTAHTLIGKMQIIYLPDLDEQYVIKSKNALAKSAFGLTFNDDGSLAAVSGNHDATTVTVSLLQQVDKTITAARGSSGRSSRRPRPGAKSGDAKTKAYGLDKQNPKVRYYQLVERFYIRPGLYRLNKPWEIAEGPPADLLAGCGLLAQSSACRTLPRPSSSSPIPMQSEPEDLGAS